MEKITTLEELANYLRANIDNVLLFKKENIEDTPFDNFQNGFESGYANSYANLLCILEPEYLIYLNNLAEQNKDSE